MRQTAYTGPDTEREDEGRLCGWDEYNYNVSAIFYHITYVEAHRPPKNFGPPDAERTAPLIQYSSSPLLQNNFLHYAQASGVAR